MARTPTAARRGVVEVRLNGERNVSVECLIERVDLDERAVPHLQPRVHWRLARLSVDLVMPSLAVGRERARAGALLRHRLPVAVKALVRPYLEND